jgi:diguanylate cyclase (GGDEF)-like protein
MKRGARMEIGNFKILKNAKLINSKVLILTSKDNQNMPQFQFAKDVLTMRDCNVSLKNLEEEDIPDFEDFDLVVLSLGNENFVNYKNTIRKNSELVPVLYIGERTEEKIIEAFDVGVIDYMCEPFSSIELLSRILNHLQLSIIQRDQNEYMKKTEILIEDLKKMAKFDALTNAYNRRSFEEFLETEIKRFKRHKVNFSIALADIDHFKKINDTYGHNYGDIVLKSISSILREGIRDQDIVARWGGEEFIFLFPETESDGAMIVLNKVRDRILKNHTNESNKPNITMTFGCAVFDGTKSALEVIKDADSALYFGKENGRNQINPYRGFIKNV